MAGIQTVLVTGGAGFIGSHLVPLLLKAQYRVRVIDNLSSQIHGDFPAAPSWLGLDGVEFQRGSVLSSTEMTRAMSGVDAIVHLAAETGTGQSMYEIARYNEVNSQGTALIFDLLTNDKSLGIERFLLASSRAIYGEGAYICEACDPDRRLYPAARDGNAFAAGRWEPLCPCCSAPLTAVATRETDQASPASVYAATKYAQEDIVRICCSALRIDHKILRLQNVYGEGQSLDNPYTGILSIFSTRIRMGAHLPLFEDGNETRDFIHVEDVARAFVAALQSPSHATVFNVGRGIRTSITEIATLLCRAFEAPPNLVVTGQYRLGDIRHNCAYMRHTAHELKFTPSIDLAQGLQRFAKWVLNNPLPEDKSDAANRELVKRYLGRAS